jgi:hypothetical protein
MRKDLVAPLKKQKEGVSRPWFLHTGNPAGVSERLQAVVCEKTKSGFE